MKKPPIQLYFFARILALAFLLGGCVGAAPSTTQEMSSISSTAPAAAVLPAQTLPAAETATPLPVARLGFSPAVPEALRAALQTAFPTNLAQPGQPTDLNFDLAQQVGQPDQAVWVYALVAPFPTLVDQFSAAELRSAWQGTPPDAFARTSLRVSPETRRVFEALWGPAQGVETVPAEDLFESSWAEQPAWAIVPFEDLEPRWKVLRVDGLSPLDRGLDLQRYPLAIHYQLKGVPERLAAVKAPDQPVTNRDEQLMTRLVMTGVTALTRTTAERMDEKGITYPAEEIGSWLQSADLTHISNEVSFYDGCPPPERRDPRFCSDPDYLKLLEAVGTDVVELTGNHILDWGFEPFLETLEIYRQQGWAVYGGGTDQESARQAVTVIDHGNHLAFIGCNAAGPEAVWATQDQPGAARCDFDWLTGEVSRLREEGWLVIVTFQHVEVCQLEPHLAQHADFDKPAVAGAVIVSGSQAHCPQAAAFKGDTFIHYGLGNLFFDQMDFLTRRQVLDRHVFYNGRYISTELLTTILEDYARPRPATPAERQKLLEDIFRASGWLK